MTSPTTTILITGANRGLGLAIVANYLLRPSYTVIAAVRNPNNTSALQALPKHETSRLVTVKIDSEDLNTPASAIDELKSKHGIHSLDVVLANAGISAVYPLAVEARPEDLRSHFEVNVIGPLALFQATVPLLQASKNSDGPKFVAMCSSAGSIAAMERAPVPNSAYGTSKAALNYITRKIHFENEGLTAFAIHPGWVQTDMGNAAAWGWGLKSADITVEESVSGVVKVMDRATREASGGKFLTYSGEEWAW